jgi:hypothetical protein
MCVSSCPAESSGVVGTYAYNGICIIRCPSGFYANALRVCVTVGYCDTNTFGENSTSLCVSQCLTGYADSISRYCIAVCPSLWYSDIQNSKPVCTQLCSNSAYNSPVNNSCVSTCQVNYYANSNGLCVSTCLTGYADPVNNKCTSSCTTGTFGNPITNTCVEYCP